MTTATILQPRTRDQDHLALRIDHLLIIRIIATRDEVYLRLSPITRQPKPASEAGNEEKDHEIHAARGDRRPEYR